MHTTIDLSVTLGTHDVNATNALIRECSSLVLAPAHLADPFITLGVANFAKANSVPLGAGIAYPTGDAYKRRGMLVGNDPVLTQDDLRSIIRMQIAAFSHLSDGKVPFIRAEGDLHADTQRFTKAARVVAEEAARVGAVVKVQSDSALALDCVEVGVETLVEGLPERGLDHYGMLVNPGLPHGTYTSARYVSWRGFHMATGDPVDTHGFNSDLREYTDERNRFPSVKSLHFDSDLRSCRVRVVATKALLVEQGLAVGSPFAAPASV